MKTGMFTSFDGTQIFVYVWDKIEKKRGVVQIFHGMAEHAKRYEHLAQYLNKNGYIVVADDHRAHGKSVEKIEDLGKYNGKDLFFDTLQDELFISQKIKEDYNLPLFVFGHSYGSFLCQAYLQQSSMHTAAIICGSALMKGRIDTKLGRIIAKLTSTFKGKDCPATLIEKMSFGSYNKKLKSGSWLNSDNKEVEKYYADELNGKPFSAKFYIDFFGAFNKIYKTKNTNNINRNIPLLLIAGSDDAVGDMGRSMTKLNNFYKKLGLNTQFKLYENARHEIINEPIKQTVYEDVLNFINQNNK